MRHDQGRAIDLREQDILNCASVMRCTTKIGASAIGQDDAGAFAKYCQKEWPDDHMKQAVATIIRKRGLN